METKANELRVVDLADEFGISISETLALCEMFDIPAPYGSSIISPEAAELLRGLARGDIDPNNADPNLINAARAESAAPPPPPPIDGEGDFESLRLVLGGDNASDEPDSVDVDSGDLDGPSLEASQDSLESSRAKPSVGGAPTPARPLAKRTNATRASSAEIASKQTTPYEPGKPLAAYDDIDKFIPKWLKYAAAVVLLVVGVLSYRLLSNGEESTIVAVGASQEPVFDEGDCFVADPSLWIDTIQIVPCTGAHDGEVFDSVLLTGGEFAVYPQESDMRSQARQACRGSFVSYTGESSIVSEYDIGVSIPSATDWLRGGRLAYCSVTSPDGSQLEGSASK